MAEKKKRLTSYVVTGVDGKQYWYSNDLPMSWSMGGPLRPDDEDREMGDDTGALYVYWRDEKGGERRVTVFAPGKWVKLDIHIPIE